MDDIVQAFIKTTVKDNSTVEFETQIGDQSTTVIDYQNVIQWLLYSGFTIEDPRGADIFRVVVSDTENRYRFELTNLAAIQHYCKTSVLLNPLIYSKTSVMKHAIPDFRSKLALNIETLIPEEERPPILEMLKGVKKSFRFMNRVRLTSPKYPFVFDCSIVKTSNDITTLFDKDPEYEIEAEFTRKDDILKQIQQAITFASRGFQRTYYPITVSEMKKVVDEYTALTSTRDFIGPGSITLQQNHVEDHHIFGEYVVTEKADGERKMLFITNQRIYLLTSALKVEYTGFTIKGWNGTLIDGEHVTKDKNRNAMNAYLAFDLYFNPLLKSKSDVRALPFLALKGASTNPVDTRYIQLNSILKTINEKRSGESSSNLTLSSKQFVPATPAACTELVESDKYTYHTDGIIFTPIQYGVGMTSTKTTVTNKRFTWELSFKWKPPEENTIDFYVTIADASHYKTTATGAEEYKTLNLMVGFNRNDINPHGTQYVNHQYCIWNKFDVLPAPERTQNIMFKPGAIPHKAFVYSPDGSIRTQYGEPIESKMIIECKYDHSLDYPEGSKWVPLRVRWDKMVRRNPNALTTALNNWNTIVNPISIDMLSSANRTVYYEHVDKDQMAGLRKFHNHNKYKLLEIIRDGDTVLDLAVGKGGDLQKWKKASFVLGVDIFENNLVDSVDGAGQRYMEAIKGKKTKTRCLFLHGNSSKSIKSGEAMYTDYENAIARSILGVDPLNKSLGAGVVEHHGKASKGFNVTSIQFAVHYMFENVTTLTTFLKNVAECTALNGHFVGTCFDGALIFDKLKDKKEVDITYDGNVLCSLEKKYTQTSVIRNKSCLGYKIGVYQSTIGTQKIDEYLVFFDYFIPLMKEYGFEYDEKLSMSFKQIYETDPTARSIKMNSGEQEVSFMNRSFVFEKVREVSLLPTKLGFISL
jgi:hypothetical protein